MQVVLGQDLGVCQQLRLSNRLTGVPIEGMLCRRAGILVVRRHDGRSIAQLGGFERVSG